MRPQPKKLPRIVAPLALMAGIFLLSSQPNLGTDLGLIDLIGRKIAHVAVYAALTLLWLWALKPQFGGAGGGPGSSPVEPARSRHVPFRAIVLAALLSFVYAIFDEYHQSGVAGRSGSPIDVAIDTAGILGAGWLAASGHLARLIAAARSRYARMRSRNR